MAYELIARDGHRSLVNGYVRERSGELKQGDRTHCKF